MADGTKNVFISHYGKDDDSVQGVKKLLKDNGYALKNSSIDSTKPNQASSEDYIKGLLRSRINWAGTFVTLIGDKTHTRDWVNWEIEQANKQGKRIIGVFIRGEADAKLPKAFEKYGNALVGWQSDKIVDAIEGKDNSWNKPDGSPWENSWDQTRGIC